MGTAKPDTNLPRGIRSRKFKNKTILYVAFTYENEECRESLRIEDTPINRKNAAKALAAIQHAISHNIFDYAEFFPKSKRARKYTLKADSVSISRLLDEHIEQCRKSLSPSTIRGYLDAINAHLKPYFKNKDVRTLTASDIRTFIASLNVTAKRVRNILTPLRNVTSNAAADRLIPFDPMTGVIVKKHVNKETAKSKYEVDPFYQEEVDAILAAARKPYVRNMFQFLFWSGLRTSELIALCWDDIDWRTGEVFVQYAVVEDKLKETKTDAGRRKVLLLPEAITALTAQKELTMLIGTARENFVFRNYTGQRWKNDAQIRENCWRTLLRRAKVRYRNPYQTRHTFATRYLAQGESPEWVAEQMGHVDTEMLIKTYGKKRLRELDSETGYKLKGDYSRVRIACESQDPSAPSQPLDKKKAAG